MKLAGLTPEAHGTLRALRNLSEIRSFDRKVAQELVQHRYAKLVTKGHVPKLVLTPEGNSVRLAAAR